MKKYINEKQVAAITGFSCSKLRNDRFKGVGIPYCKAGKAVRYDVDDVIRFMDRHKIRPE